MQEDLMQNTIQPFIKLAQSNMDLITKMMPTPEAMSTSMSEIEKMFRHQPGGLPANFSNVNAFGHMAQCMFQNYIVCMMEIGRCATAAMTQGQQTLQRTAQQATEVLDQGARRYQQQSNHHDKKAVA